MREVAGRSPLVLLAVCAATMLPAMFAAPADARPGQSVPVRKATATCDQVLVLRRGTVRTLLRKGYRAAGKGTFVRRVKGRTLRVCTRRTVSPGWVNRPLGGRVHVPARRLRSGHDTSGLDFPATLSGPFRINLPDGLGTSGWRMLDVPAAKLVRFRGGARYETSDYDVVLESGYGTVKESIVVHTRQGVRTWRWRLTYTKGRKPYIDGAGRIVYGGKVVLAAPVVLNARNRVSMRPKWKLRGNIASFTVNDRRLGLPYVVDPTADFPQRIHPMSTANAVVTGSENVSLATGPASSCTKLPIDGVGESIWGSMIARNASPGAAIATATPSGGPNGWAIQDGTAAFGTRIYAMEAADDQTIYAAGELGYILRSLDGGCSWTRHWTGTTAVLRGISAPSPSVVWVAGDNGTIRRSTNANGAATFGAADGGVPNQTLYDIDALDANVAMTGGTGKYVGYTSNGGGAWANKNEPNMGDVWSVDIVGTPGSPPYPAWVVTSPSKVYRADNMNGNTNPQIGYKFQNVADFRSISAVDGEIAWAVGATGAIYKTVNGSSNGWLWTQQAVGLTGQQFNWVQAVDASNAFAAGTGGTIAQTTNGGATWTLQANAAGGNEIVTGAARSASLAWVGDASGRIQRRYPGGGAGSYGWTSASNGGTTLSGGTWTIGARVCREPLSTGTIDVGFRARVWKIRTAAGAITASTPMTTWSAASPQATLGAGACYSPTVTATPTSRSMLPTEYFYVEYALKVYNNSRAYETISLTTGHADTYIDFSAPATDSTPPPTNLRHSSFMGPSGYTGDTTPTLRANLNDPDWYHHIRYQICADALCNTLVAEGTSPAGQVLGSTTDSWTSPALAEGFYYMRARTEEDGGESDASPWTTIDPNPAVGLCPGTNLGPCDKFGIDTGPPGAPGSPADGLAADIAFTPSATQLSANWTAAPDGAGILNYEYCMSTATSGAVDCAGTIVQAWTSTGSNDLFVTRTGLALTNAQIYYTCVRAIDLAGNVGPSVCTNGQTVDTASPPQTAGLRDGSAADLDYTASTTQLQSNWDTITDVAGGSGLASYDACFSTSSTGVDCGAGATSPWASTGMTTNTLRTGLTLTNGATYFACVRGVDNVGNLANVACSNGIIVDTGAPTASWTSWTESSPWLHAPGGANADLLWFNSTVGAGAGTATATVTATDPASGMNRVDFPNLGAGAAWGPGGSDTTVGLGNTWSWNYSFAGGGAGDPALNNATAIDNVGNATGAPALNFRIEPDGAGPTGGSMTPLTGLQSTTTYTQTIQVGTDALSGVGSWVLDLRTAPLEDGVCGAWDPWFAGDGDPNRSGAIGNGGIVTMNWLMNDFAPGDGIPDFLDSWCLETKVRVYDNVGNETLIPSNGMRRFDFADPEVSISGPADGSDQRGTFDITGRTNDLWEGTFPEYPDTGSGIQEVNVTWELADGPDADALPDATGTACASITTFTGTWDDLGWTCSWNTTAPLLADGDYTVFVRARDRSGRWSTVVSRTYRLDNNPPIINWHSWNEVSGSSYTHTVGSIAWVNSVAAPGTFQLDARVTATDAGSGVNRVEFPALGAGWTPAAITNGAFTSPTPAANAYTLAYTWTTPTSLAEPGVVQARAFDGAGNSSTTSFEVRLDGNAPTEMLASVPSGLQNTPIVNVTIAPGTDEVGGSGLGTWALEFDWAPLVNDTCGAWNGTWNTAVGGAGTAPAAAAHDVTALGSRCYRYRMQVADNVGNTGFSAPVGARRVDLVPPAVDITSPADASSQSATFSIGGTATDAHSGIDRVRLTWTGPEAPGTGVICDPATLGGSSPAWSFTCSWNTTTFDDGWYTITATSYDRAGNASATDSITVLVDNQPPMRAWHSWNDFGSAFMHSLGNVAWVNPTAPAGAYQLDARMTASDAGSGVNRVEFPGFGAGWTPAAGVTNAAFTSPLPVADAFTMEYTFANPAALAPPGALTATAFDGAGNFGSVGFEVRLDGNDPTGMTASVVNGRQSTAIVAVTLGAGSEPALESGLASWALLVDTAPLTNDACGAFTGTWSPVTSGVGIAPASYNHDVTALGSQCYRYRLDVTDNVGNVGSSTPATARRVDLTPPTVDITSPATGSVLGSTFAISGTAGDAHSGIDRVRLTWAGPEAPGTGVICDPATLGGASPSWTFSCDWATFIDGIDDGTYVVTATSYDLAGNVSATDSITIFLDNFPPFVGFHSFVEATPYTFWAGPIGTNNELWYNPTAPAGNYAFDVQMTASDASGVDRVEFDAAGAGWTGGLPATQTAPVGPADRYAQTYSFNTSGVVADPPTLNATAFDPAGNNDDVQFELTPDSAAPATGSVSNPNSYNPSTTVVVNVATGTDGAGSGIQGWTLLRATGTLSAGTCIGWTGYATTVATGVGMLTGTRNDVVADGDCARYRLVVTDNVGNVGTFTGTDETKIDLTPPTGSITLSENTGTQWTHLASPTRLFVNTGAGRTGTFDANVTANAASGILDVTFPTLAAGFTGAGVMPGPGPNFVRTYTWTGPAGAPPASVDAAVRSNSLGSLDLPFEVVADPDAPTGATVAHPGGYTTSTTLTINYTSGGDGGGSGLAGYQLERETGTLAGGACAWTGTWDPAGPAGGASYADTLVHATCYRYRVASTDNVGNVGYSPVSAARMVDTTAPTGASITITENANTAEQWVSAPDTIWVKAAPTAPASFNVSVTATDPESGTGAAVFPALGSTFTFTSTGAFTGRYAWAPTALTPGAAPIVQVANGAGLTTTIPFTVNIDGDAPTGATLDQENGFVTDFLVDLSYTTGGDGAGSGIETWRIERQRAPYTIATDTCGVWTAWTVYPSAPGQPASPHVDSSVAQPNCYRYRVVEIDRVGNRTDTLDTTGDITKVIYDITPPTAFSLNLPTNPVVPAITTGQPAPACGAVPTYATATPALTWSASSDTESGLSHYDVYVDGIGAVDGTVAAPGTSWTPPALTDGAHTLGVRALDFQANFRNADPAFPANFQIDTAAPTGSLNAPAMGSWSGDTTPTLDWNAADATCLARVEVYLDGAGVPAAVASGTEGSWTPSAALADGAHTWTFVAWDVAGNSSSFGPYSFGIDTTPPTAFAITAPAGGTTVRGFVDVAWSASSDLESGLAPAAAYQVIIDGTVRATRPAGTTSTTVSGITNGVHSIVIRAFDVVGNTRDTAAVLFTGYPAIPVPVLVSPANNAWLNTVPLLDWDWPSDGGPPPTSYNVYLNGANVGSELYPTTDHTLGADPGDGSHTWRIEQIDPYTGTVTSLSRTFVIDRTPPIVDATLTRVATVVSWSAPTDPALPVASGIANQQFWIDPDGAAAPYFSSLGAAVTSRDYGALPDGGYTMWVRAYDRAGNFTDTPSIYVMNDSVPPTAFNLDAPAALPALPAITNGPAAPTCETAPTYTSATPTLSWQASSDATSGLAGYDVYVDGALLTSVGPATTSHTLVAPLTGGAHNWHVVARDNFGLSRASTPNPMNVRIDAAAPAIAYASPADNSYTADTTPSFSWNASDDNCLARVELTIGASVYVFSNVPTSFSSPIALPEGPTTWSLRAFDSAGRVTSAGAPRTVIVDTTPPNGLTAIFPANGATENEGMLTFSWTAGADTGSGVARYDLVIDGTTVATNILGTSNGTHQILGGAVVGTTAPHNWSVRAFDAVGNSAVFPFSFLAMSVPDTTPPDPFDLLTPADGAPLAAGDSLTWSPSWDFKGVSQYRVYIDGSLAATVPGNVTSFTPTTGAGAPICTVDFDPGLSAGCLAGPTYGGAAASWNTTSAAGWSAAGNALGVGDQTLPITNSASGFDGNSTNTSVTYQTTVPAAGGEIRLEHRYNTHMIGETAYDGVAIEINVNGGGWESVCEIGAVAIYGVGSVDCDYEIIEHDGAPNVALGMYNSLPRRNAFAGDSGGVVLTKLRMADFAGSTVQLRFVLATDACHRGTPAMPPDRKAYCDDPELGAPGYFPIQWRVDNLTLAQSSLLPGLHTWFVRAVDPSGNMRQSNQTWQFDLQP